MAARLRRLCRAVSESKSCQIVSAGLLLAFVYFLYVYLGSLSSFSKENEKFYRNEGFEKLVRVAISRDGDEEDPSPEHPDRAALEIPVFITFTKAAGNRRLQEKFKLCTGSMLENTGASIVFHIIGDAESQRIAEGILRGSGPRAGGNHRVVPLDIEPLAQKLQTVVTKMQQLFSYQPGAYYSDALFFLSIAIHRVLPEALHRVILLDADLKFNSDIAGLYGHFSSFRDSNIIGIARELQPVYRHAFHLYRNRHPGTRVGEPPPGGLTGFNSGVLLLDLDRMRKSELYNSLLQPEAVHNLTAKYLFKGHLGDQDFFTLISLEHEQLFYVLPCTWNRQLCQWWRDNGYADVFHLYFQCQSPINVYHGNCNTPIP